MKFGPVAIADIEGAFLAHSVDVKGKRLRKGTVLGTQHIAQLRDSGLSHVVVARLDPSDVAENDAATALAQALVPNPRGAGVRLGDGFTGRVNILADGPGVAVLDVVALEAFNRVHPMITLATVPPYTQMRSGGMMATIKIISYAVPRAALDQACAVAKASIRLARPKLKTAGLIVTEIPGGAGEKGRAAIESRIEALGMQMADFLTVPHDTSQLAQAITAVQGDMVLILTGSATSDEQDVGPAALRRAGGRVERFGMPVDPGNLLFLGHAGARPVIGLPGCARAPALNGADWVLARVACGINVSADDISRMGVGGLLKEIPSRPQPRRQGANRSDI
jgi:molybdenum cofactor cytidylyltransferase